MEAFIIPEHQLISINGMAVKCEFSMDARINNITWSGKRGVIQYNDETPNQEIFSIEPYNYLVDVYWEAYGEQFKPTQYHVWDIETKTWRISPEDQSVIGAEKQTAAEEQAAKESEIASNPISNLSLEEIDAWVENNITDLASIQNAFKKIARLLKVKT